MAQKKVTEFFQNRKRVDVELVGHASKRAKLETPYTKLRKQPVGEEIEEKIVAFTTASIDDHSIAQRSTPPKRSLKTGDPAGVITGKKRPRGFCAESGGFKTAEKGYDFSAFTTRSAAAEGLSPRRKLLRKKPEPLNSTTKSESRGKVESATETNTYSVKIASNVTEDPDDEQKSAIMADYTKIKDSNNVFGAQTSAVLDTGPKETKSLAGIALNDEIVTVSEVSANATSGPAETDRQSTKEKNADNISKSLDNSCQEVVRVRLGVKKASVEGSQKDKLDSQSTDVEMMKKRLAKCGNLVDLQQTLTRLSQAKAKLGNKATDTAAEGLKEKLMQYDQAKQKLSSLRKEQIDVQISTETSTDKKKLAESGEKRHEVKAPAHDRYHSLAEPGLPCLALPLSYSVLLDMFRCSDNVVKWLDNRSEICTFDKLRKAVEQATRKRFELKHLGQFKTVYPTAYLFRQEKNLPCVGGKVSNYQLTVEAVLVDSAGAMELQENAKNKPSLREKIAFTAAKIVERKNRFTQNLIEIVKRYHKEFLSKLKFPLKVADDKLTRWHPKFVLDEVPEIEPAELPQKPDEKKITSAQEALKLCSDKYDQRTLRALEIVANKTKADGSSEFSVSSVDRSKPIAADGNLASAALTSSGNKLEKSSNVLKGVSQSLLERIRAKEAQIAQARMTRSPEVQKELEQLQRLPELIRILRAYFVGQKRPAIPIGDAIENLTSSYRSYLGPVEAECHLRLIAKVVPQWMEIIKLKSKGEYVKILDGNMELGRIISQLEKRSAELQCKSGTAK